ncbi:response regulator receiver protein [Denitrovibrio acetiphilus DSM 12809]|uniref:Response regulator receiver protein n=1 Tax=Denitrovibrio acetiphilus (strain DSM 12809 / NBRC 114555 / N2460) TaxID=522772 RepID=D4H1L1_DENA2|nr:response regulator [Denitrovibrio acetiphilus]ADD68771.1 response regulator receiver protein [Denitrovibrio acetiphilus DSM 12809]
MSDSSILRDITKDLTVLCVDDEPLAREYLSLKLKRSFKEVYTADDGMTGLEVFHSEKPDLIITDNRMSYMDGIEMIMQIREEDPDIPIILTTAYTEKDALVDAINCNVNQFLSKPLDAKQLERAIEKSMLPIVNARLAEKTLRQELELLQYREKYHSHQENNAFKKELSLILNDYFLQKFDIKNKYNEKYSVFMNIFYRPLDVLSGDIYSIRKLADGTTLIFLADSMGKGLSASVTSILTTSYINHIIDTEDFEVTSSLKNIISCFNRYIKGILLDDEILSIMFLKLDFFEETMEYANFSSPPIFIKDKEGEVVSLKCNNPPLTKYLDSFKTQICDTAQVVGILAITDGLYESTAKDGDIIMSRVKDYYERNIMKTDFHNDVREFVDDADDDVSCIHITKLSPCDSQCHKYTFSSSLKNVGKAIEWLEAFFNKEGLDIEDSSMLTLAFTELTMNAFEHSVLELDNRRKYKMINDGLYDDYINTAVSDKEILVAVGLRSLFGKRYVYIKINDEGTGFDPHSLKIWMYDKEQNDGKGVKISRRIIDEIYYSQDGKEATIIRVLED